MTTIAWDGKTLAADKMGDRSGLRTTLTKIWRWHGTPQIILAGCGRIDHVVALKDWYENGAIPENYPAFQSNDDKGSTLIVVRGALVFVYQATSVPVPIENCFDAWGSGRDFAISGMSLGLTAREAVEHAAKFDTGTGCGVDAFDVEPSV